MSKTDSVPVRLVMDLLFIMHFLLTGVCFGMMSVGSQRLKSSGGLM